MANEFDNTALNAAVQELWDFRVQEARYIKAVVWNKVLNSSQYAKKKGDIVHISIDQRWTVGTMGSDGSFVPQNYVLASIPITMDQWVQIAPEITDRAEAQAFWTPGSVFPKTAGMAFGSRYDSDLLGQHASFTTTPAGDTVNPSLFDKQLAQEALYQISLNNVPLDELYFFVHNSSYFRGLFNEVQLTDANKTGYDKSIVVTGKQFMIAGVPVYTTNNVALVGSVRKNLLVHSSGLGIAFNFETKFESQRAIGARKATTVFLAQSLYGTAVPRTDHGVVINSKA